MRRRDLTLALAAGAGLALLPLHVRRAFAQAESGDEESDVVALELLLGELAEADGQRIDAVGRSEIPASARSSIQVNGTDAGLQAPQLTAQLGLCCVFGAIELR